MYHDNAILHRINYGDTLYSLAVMYGTTVEDIMNANPGVNPYDLRVGQDIKIVPSYNVMPRQSIMAGAVSKNEFELSKKMRLAWADHSYWDRLVIISIVDSLGDTNSAVNRVLRTAKEISDPFRPYYGDDMGNTLNQLLTEHIAIAGDLIKATKNNDAAGIARHTKDWYGNADKMAYEFSNVNPYYNFETTRNMLYRHLDLLREQLANRLAGNYDEDVNSSDRAVNEAMMMADYFVDGIVKQFPDMFVV